MKHKKLKASIDNFKMVVGDVVKDLVIELLDGKEDISLEEFDYSYENSSELPYDYVENKNGFPDKDFIISVGKVEVGVKDFIKDDEYRLEYKDLSIEALQRLHEFLCTDVKPNIIKKHTKPLF